MNWLLASLRLLRLPNLIVVFLTQGVPYWFVLRPAINRAGGIPVLTERSFSLLAAATLLTTLAGYVINDYFDRDIDAINKPKHALIGRIIPPGIWLIFYWILLGAITVTALELYRELPYARAFWPLWLFSAISGGLFLYAWQLKCSPLTGNLFVSLLCALVPVILLVPEDRPLWLASFRQPEIIDQAKGLIWLYALFAFVTNLFREQIKSLEDFHGDAACGCKTLPVIKGVLFAKKPTGFTGIISCVLIGFLIFFWTETQAPAWQVYAGIVLLFVPTLAATFIIYFATAKRHFSWASALIKLVMFTGVFLLLRSWPENPLSLVLR